MTAYAILNFSTDSQITTQVLNRISDAVQVQLTQHFCPTWGGGAVVSSFASEAQVPSGWVKIGVFDSAPDDGVLGEHEDDVGQVFWTPIKAAGGTLLIGATSLAAVMSHEILEAQGDIGANQWALGSDGKLYAIEACDAIENLCYDIDGVSVSDFVYRQSFFDPLAKGPFDIMQAVTAPFQTRDGYQILMDPASGQVSQVQSAARAAWRPTSRFAKRGGRVITANVTL